VEKIVDEIRRVSGVKLLDYSSGWMIFNLSRCWKDAYHKYQYFSKGRAEKC